MINSFQIPQWLSSRKVFIVLSISIFILLPLLSINSGISGDEPVHYQHAEYVYDYFSSDGEDQSALNTPRTYLKYYGQVVDNFSYWLNKLTQSKNPYLTRHIINAILGALMIIFSGLLAIQLAGYRAGILSLIFLFLSPRILGHSFNNLKDIPFALGYIMAVYGLVCVIRKYPAIRPLPWVWMCLGLAISLGTRAGGFILIPVFFLFTLLRWIIDRPIRDLVKWKAWKNGFVLIGLLLITCLAGFFLAILAWPYALQAPIKNSIESLSVMTNYSVSIRQLFEGQWLWSEHLPAYYPMKYILITSPLIVLLGFVLQYKLWNKKTALILCLLNFVFIFPLIWIIINGSNLYGGWRHLLFVYPTLVILSASSWLGLWDHFRSRLIRALILVLLLFGLFGPLVHTIKNHPLEYIYFNKSVGGIKNAQNLYETDYYFHSLGPATRWLKKYLAENETRESLILASNFPVDPYFSNNPEITPVYTHYFSRSVDKWDYGIFVNTYVGPDYLDSKNWPPQNCIHTIKVDGKVICSIVKRKTMADAQGINLYKNGNYQSAINQLEKALSLDPRNESAQLYLSWAYRQIQQFELSDSIALSLLYQQPMNDMARDVIGRNLISRGEYESAIKNFQVLNEQNYKYLPAYEQAARAADSLQNYKLASRFLERGYQLGLRDQKSLDRLIKYLQMAGYHGKAEKFRTILNKK